MTPEQLWREQPDETAPVLSPQLQRRRARDLAVSTRSDILGSLAAAMLFVLVLALRMDVTDLAVQLSLALPVAWTLLTLYRFRARIWPSLQAQPADEASPSLAFYRVQLEQRRDHLRSAWIWNGPLLLACLTLVAVGFARNPLPGIERLRTIAPFLLLLAAWVVAGIWRRRRWAAEIQREIDEIATAGE